MRTFTDNASRTWTVAVNVGTLKRVKALTGTDLLEVIEGRLVERLIADPVLLVDILYAACKPEADARNVTDEAFGQAMGGDAVEQATEALLEELVDFFPRPRRALLRKALEKYQAMEATALRLAEKQLDALDPETALLPATSGEPSGSPPESPDAGTPTG